MRCTYMNLISVGLAPLLMLSHVNTGHLDMSFSSY